MGRQLSDDELRRYMKSFSGSGEGVSRLRSKQQENAAHEAALRKNRGGR